MLGAYNTVDLKLICHKKPENKIATHTDHEVIIR